MAFIAKWDGSEGTPDKAITLELIPAGKKFFELYEMELLVGEWITEKSFHLVIIDAKKADWLPEIQTRELFEKLNEPNTVLLIKNYATVSGLRGDDNSPRNLLRNVAVKRHYGCGNDFAQFDELSNLLFVVAINDLSEMHIDDLILLISGKKSEFSGVDLKNTRIILIVYDKAVLDILKRDKVVNACVCLRIFL